MTIRRIPWIIFAAALLASCAGLQFRYQAYKAVLPAGPAPSYPAARFAVISDAHLYDAGLGVTGKAFQDYMDDDRKLLPESAEILAQALTVIRKSGVDFLLISGDLTKDGEKRNHELMASRLKELAKDGIPVIVVPGNHDVLNPDSKKYQGDAAVAEPTVTPEEFAEIYRDFGYSAAIKRDPASLSYVTEPVPGLWILALSSLDYAENMKKGTPKVDGRFTQETADWMEGVLADAAKQGKAVIAMMHHGAMEHYPSQEKYYGDYIVDDAPAVAALFAAYNVRAVFTGHHHAQDVTLYRAKEGKFLYDFETGSLIGATSPIRMIEITPSGSLNASTRLIDALPSFVAQGRDFAAYAEGFVRDKIELLARKTMTGLGVPEAEARKLAPQIGNAFIAHYKGDEKFTGTEMLTLNGLSFMGGIIMNDRKDLITGLWKDLEPPDSALVIDLATGEWKALP